MYCALEHQEFPDNEFVIDPAYGYVHAVHPRHTTLGEFLKQEPIPGLPADALRADALPADALPVPEMVRRPERESDG
jgi:hypothetical protein